MADVSRTKVILTTKGDNYYGEFDWKYFYLFPAHKLEMPDVVYWMAWYKSKDSLDKKIAGEKVDGDMFTWIRTRQLIDKANGQPKLDKDGNQIILVSGLVTDNEARKAWRVNVYDNKFKAPGNDYDKYLEFTETEYRERQPKVDENLPF